MSFESGRKFGTIASLIAVITPVLGVVGYIFFFVSLFASLSPGTNAPSLFPLSLSIIILYATIGSIALAGFVLFFLAMRQLSHYYNEPSIFKNTLYGFIINIAGTIGFVIIYVVLIGSLIHNVQPSNVQTTAFTPIPTVPPAVTSIGTFFLSFLGVLAIAFVIGIVGAVFYMRAFNKLAEKSGVDNFKTVGLLFLLGVVLSVVGVGALLVWIAWILALIGFRSLKPKGMETQAAFSTPQLAPVIGQRKFCSYCGAENNLDALYCRACGRKLQ